MNIRIHSVIILLLAFSLAALPLAAQEPGTATGPGMNPLLFAVILFLICTVIGIFAVLGGVGGGIIFVPLMLGFTNVDSYIVRTTGVFIAMTGSLIVSRPYLSRGLANFRILFIAAVPFSVFSIVGAVLAGYMHATAGAAGEAIIRGTLGLIVIGVAVLFIVAGNKSEYPDVKKVDRFTALLDLSSTYHEASLDRTVSYRVTRVGAAMPLFCIGGLISGLFGLGAGWVIVPIFNLVMLTPLKVAAMCSTVMLAIGNTAAIWPYIAGGGMFPLLAVPCMLGMNLGATIGTKIMFKARPKSIRYIIILIMFAAGIRLLLRAGAMLMNGS